VQPCERLNAFTNLPKQARELILKH